MEISENSDWNRVIINKRFLICKELKITENSIIHLGIDKKNNMKIAIKIEDINDQFNKSKKMNHLLKKVKGMPKIIWRGKHKNKEGNNLHNIIVSQLAGPSLKDYFNKMYCMFTKETIFIIGLELLNILEDLHSKSIVYTNLKPSKILTSLDFDSNNLFIIDYKYARVIKDQIKKIESDNKSKHIMLNKFSSLNAHLGINPTNKDDLESLGYILMYFYKKGNLFNSKNLSKQPKSQKNSSYMESKLTFIPETFFSDDPNLCLTEYFNYLKYLPHGQNPDYRFIKNLFKNYLKNLSVDLLKFRYDWVKVLISENVDLSNLNLTLTRPNVDVAIKKEKKFEDSSPLTKIELKKENECFEEKKEIKLFIKRQESRNFSPAPSEGTRLSSHDIPNMKLGIKFIEEVNRRQIYINKKE